MEVISTEHRRCESCMKEHDVRLVKVKDELLFKDTPVVFDAEFYYCENSDELYASEELFIKNDISLKNDYRKKKGLLTSDEIVSIRKKYGISQSDLCKLLGWGGKTIARYETHQVQDKAHDSILRKIDEDPEWFLRLLDAAKKSVSKATYERCRKKARAIYGESYDHYMEKALNAKALAMQDR